MRYHLISRMSGTEITVAHTLTLSDALAMTSNHRDYRIWDSEKNNTVIDSRIY